MMKYKKLLSQYTRSVEPIPTGIPRQGSLEKNIRSILFDVYGTLFISGSGDIGTMMTAEQTGKDLKQLFQAYHIQEPRYALQSRMFRAVQDQHARLRKEGVDYPEVQIDDIWMQAAGFKSRETAREFALAYELIVNPVFPMPHLPNLLETCHQKKIMMGIISNAQFYTPLLFEWFLGKKLEALGFKDELLIFSYQFGYAKPSRFLFAKALDQIEAAGIRSNQVLYVGNDMLNDITPAQKTGFKTALFAGDARSLRMRDGDSRCDRVKPDLVISDLIQLVDYI